MIPQIVLFGPECSGKTTLANKLQSHYHGILVPEYLRIYGQAVWDSEQRGVDQRDVPHLIKGQYQLEETALKDARTLKSEGKIIEKPVFYDTNIHQLAVYFDHYFGPKWGEMPLNILPEKDQCVYLLTRPDIPWEADDLRDRPLEREALFSIFESYLNDIQADYVTVSGDLETRMATACSKINQTWPQLHVKKT